DLVRDLVRDRDLVRARDLALELARELALACDSAIFLSWLALLANLLADELALITARTRSKARQTRPQYAAQFIGYVYPAVIETTSPPWWRRWWRVSRVAESRNTKQRALLEYYWWLQIIMAREAGALSAWEGIRIVRKPMESTAGEVAA